MTARNTQAAARPVAAQAPQAPAPAPAPLPPLITFGAPPESRSEQFLSLTRGRGIRALEDITPGKTMMRNVVPLIAVNTNVNANLFDAAAFFLGENNNVAANLHSIIGSALGNLAQNQFNLFRELTGRFTSPFDVGRAPGSLKDIHRFERNSYNYAGPHPNNNNRKVCFVVVYHRPSFINHSCKPNAMALVLDNGYLDLIAVRHIGANMRKQQFSHNYGIQCKCECCTDVDYAGKKSNADRAKLRGLRQGLGFPPHTAVAAPTFAQKIKMLADAKEYVVLVENVVGQDLRLIKAYVKSFPSERKC
ncbi:hypothetical protein CC86DRAFT_377250 [Ophiobolus disseminans]|uniref:SET domain-containing protein n=1 Tax=Ophiobolus disseminans TaxID=1469910 RepID=A0A6A7AGG9_9PLEO|nr:hypothetical protein CC86DRAFT_377250 [Ophiobolus disseminans]